jgi:metal-responsive CopG/Arc/MetJ family transcriptional regulator
MRRTNIYLDDEQTAALDERARREGISRSELIRRLLGDALNGEVDTAGRREELKQAIEASFGIFANDDDFERVKWEANDERAQHLERIWRS